MARINYDEIKQKFVQRLAERRFLGKEYAIYLYSLCENDSSGDQYELKLDAFHTTSGYNHRNGIPFPNKIGEIRIVPYEKYQIYAFGRGGETITCATIYNEEAYLKQSELVEKPGHWAERPVYFSGYQLEDIRLVIFLVFDVDPDGKIESEIRFIYLNSVLRSVEDIYHKNKIFDKCYLKFLKKVIDVDSFSIAKKSIEEILQFDYTYSRYLLKMYYMFLFENFRMFDGKLKDDQKEKLLELTREFETNQKNLFRIPYYRDHFLHQSNVYLLGLAVISILCKNDFSRDLAEDFNRAYRPMGGDKYRTNTDIALAWFIASLFHDIAYPVEKSGQWMDAFFKQYIYPERYHKNILKIDLNISNVVSDRAYSQCIEDLSEYHRKLHYEKKDIGYQGFRSDDSIRKACNIRSYIIDQIINFRDHGVLSAIMLLNRFDRFDKDKNIFKYLFPAAGAVSVHNFLWTSRNEFKEPCDSCRSKGSHCKKCEKWKKEYKKYFEKEPELEYIDFEKDPLGFLLILCDTLQDWGRYDFENLKHAYDRFFNQSHITDIRIEDKDIIFDLNLTQAKSSGTKDKKEDFLLHKKQEIAKIFSRLKFKKGYDIVVNLKRPRCKPISFSMNSFQ